MASKPKKDTGVSKAFASPSSSYLAARLIDRKRAEEVLQKDHAELRKRVEEQAAHLEGLSKALGRGGVGTVAEQAQGELWRADRDHLSAEAEELRARLLERQRAEEALRAEFVEMSQRVGQQAEELRKLDEALSQECAARAESEADLRKAKADLVRRVEQSPAPTNEEWNVELARQKDATGALRTELIEVSRSAQRQAADLRSLGETVKRESQARERSEAALELALVELRREISRSPAPVTDEPSQFTELQQSEASRRTLVAELGERLDTQEAELRSLQDEVRREAAERARSGEAFERKQTELDQRVSGNASGLEAVTEACDGSAAERRRLEDVLQQTRAAWEKRGDSRDAALRSINETLEQEISERRDSHIKLEQAQAGSERRTEQLIAEIRSLSETLSREVDDRKRLEANLRQAQTELDRRVVDQVAEVDAVNGALAREVTDRRGLEATLKRMERVQEDLDRRIKDHEAGHTTPGEGAQQEVPESAGGEVAIRPSSEVVGQGGGALVPGVLHNLTVPMNGIICMTDLALDTDLTDAQRDYLERVKALAEAVLRAVNGGQRPDSDDPEKRDAAQVPFGLREHLRDTLKPLLLRANQKGLDLTCHIAPKVPNAVLGDPACFRQVLVNLVGNAIKFNEGGEVSVCVDTASQTVSDAVLLVTVADGGAGIPIEQQGAVFSALAGDPDAIAEAGATAGLGVPVSAELVRAMGGRIWFESQVGEGTSFRFTIRLALQDESESRPSWALWRNARRRGSGREKPAPKPREHQVVLLAEDDLRDRSTLKQLLEDRGFAAVTVEDGRGVLASMEHDSFDLVLMNLRMPGMDAFEAAAAIRALESGNGAQTPIVVLAADATETDQQRCLAVGIDAWIAKPIRASEVLTAIEPLLGAAAPA